MQIFTKTKLLSLNLKTTLKSFLVLMVLTVCTGVSQAQTQLAAWTFDATAGAPNTPAVNAANLGVNSANANIYADGTNGSSTWIRTTSGVELTTFGGGTENDPRGTPAAGNALTAVYAAGTSTNGKGWVIKVPTTGFEDVILTYATRGTGTGFNTQTWSYSTDGSTFTNIKTISGKNVSTWSIQTVDFSTISALDNMSFIYIKVAFSGATGSSGNNRIDNIVINASVLSTPPTVTPGAFSGTYNQAVSYNVVASNSPTSYAIASGTLPAGLSLNTTTGVISGTPTAAGSATVGVTATNAAGTSTAANIDITINKADQTITFGALADKASDDADFALTATSTSGLTISYSSSNTGVISISGTTAQIEGPGTTTITASQAGDANYNAATSVDQNQFVSNAALTDQTITFNALSDVTYGDAPFALTATASSSLSVTYTSSNELVATISGSTVTVVGVGTTTITASQAGNGSYNPAPNVTQDLNVLTKNLSVSGVVANNKVYDGTTNATLDLSGASLVGVVGADVVTFNGTGAFADANVATGVAVVTNFVLSGADAAKYTLTQPTLSANITKADQTITFAALPNKTTNDAAFALTATSTSGLTISYLSSDPLVASVSGNTVTIVGPGTTTITASQSGNINYNAATSVDQGLTVTLAPASVKWNFGTSTGSAAPSSGVPVNNLVVSNFSIGNSVTIGQTIQFNTTTPSNLSGSSAQYNAGITSENLTFNPATSSYFEFTLTPSAGYTVSLNEFSYAARSTTTGPSTLTVRTSKDDFASDVAVATNPTSGTWVLHDETISPVKSSQPLVVRIYGSVTGGSGSVSSGNAVNFRIDDVNIGVLVEALPACTSTPTAGTATAETSVFCLSGSTNINLTGNTNPQDFQGISLQWFSSTNNVDFAPISGANAATLSTGTITQTTYYYNVVSCAGSGLDATSNTVTVLISDLPTAEITGNAAYCTGGSTVLTASAGSSYDWKRDGNSFATSQSVTVNTAGSYTVTVTNENNCSATSSALVVSEAPALTAPVISGIVNVCQYIGTTEEITYTLVPVQGATSYNWTVPPAATIVSGQGTSSITITLRSDYAAFLNKQIRATAVSACGEGPIGVFFTAAQTPVTPKPITGITDVCPYYNNALEATYSIEAVSSASTYVWTVPAGVSITENLGTSIKVTFGASFVSSAITVRAVNGCGVSGARSITISRTTPSTPGTITGPSNTCLLIGSIGNPEGTNGIYIVGRTAADIVYNWTVPIGAEIISHTSTPTEDQIEVKFTTEYVGGDISVFAQNNCGNSNSRIFKLSRLNPGAPGAIAENRTGNCPDRIFEYSLISNPGGANYVQWTVPTGGTILSGQGTTTISVEYDNVAISGNVTVVGINGCRTSTARVITLKIPACAPEAFTKSTNINTGVEVEILDASIFPNPSTSSFRLKVSSLAKGAIQVNVYDITGRKRQSLKVSASEVTTFGENLKPGSYMVEVIQGNERKVSKIVKL